MNHRFHPEAALEFEEAVHFYQSRSSTLGERFSSEVRTSIQKILDHPERWHLLQDQVRCCFVHVFPYSVLYTIESDYILIIAIMHGKRRPGYWRHRLK